ncbi:MAG TPA: site-2 protease family protein [Luteolibacter sp.]|nr:site-2 protease family protein [Luteolibacter sp.]
MIHFSLFGIPVAIQPFFWVTLAIIGNPWADTPNAFLHLGLFILAGFISILVHELGHALTIKSYRVPTSITLQAFGGYASYPAGSLTRPQSFLVTAAGPALQLVLGLAAHVAIHRFPPDNGIQPFLHDLRWVSVAWAVLNLLPILPLDGGQLVNSILGPARIRITLWVTVITAGGLAAGSILLSLKNNSFSILLPLFFGMFAYQAFQALREFRHR